MINPIARVRSLFTRSVNWTDREVRRILLSAKSTGVRVSDLLGEVPVAVLGSYSAFLKYCTTKVWASWKACDLVSQSVSTTQFKLMSGETETNVPVLSQLLTYPNGNHTFSELLYLTVMHIKMTGNAYWLKADGREIDGNKPTRLVPINPKRVRIVPNPNDGTVTGYRVSLGTKFLLLDPEEVIHFKRPHPNDDYYGLGDVEAGQTPIGEAINAANHKENEWRNSGVPSGILVKKEAITDPAMTLDQWKKLKADYLAEYGGTANAGKQAFLTGDWTYLRMGLTRTELQEIEKMRLTTEEIFLLHGVPLSVAGVKDAANYATSQIDVTRYLAMTVAPMVRLIMETMNTDLITDWGEELRIEFQMHGLVNVGAVVQDLLPAFDRGVISINEMRVAIGLKPDPENPLWEEHYINASLTPLTLAGIPSNEPAVSKAAKGIVERATGVALS